MATTWIGRCFGWCVLMATFALAMLPGRALSFFPPHYGQPPAQNPTPPPHHDPPPIDNPPPTDHAPEPATLLSGAVGMGILSLYAAARRRKNKS